MSYEEVYLGSILVENASKVSYKYQKDITNYATTFKGPLFPPYFFFDKPWGQPSPYNRKQLQDCLAWTVKYYC